MPAMVGTRRRGTEVRGGWLALVLAGVACCSTGQLCWIAGGRRELIAGAVAGGIFAPTAANAFQNAVYQVERSLNDAKKPGPQPPDLGLLEREYLVNPADTLDKSMLEKKGESGILKECGPRANCFSTTYTDVVDKGFHDLTPWRFKGKTPDQAMQEVADVIAAYPPGQSGIDGGGYKVTQIEPNYLYIIFESLKRGHRDDVEFAVIPGTPNDAREGGLYVRSASRQGTYDFGVNAVRLNRIAKDLMAKGGWDIRMIDAKTHPRYWSQNCFGGDMGRKVPIVVRKQFPEFCKEFPPREP